MPSGVSFSFYMQAEECFIIHHYQTIDIMMSQSCAMAIMVILKSFSHNVPAVLVESECTDFPLPQLLDLHKFVDRANEWVNSTNTFIICKHSH
jgi:hypothetical protein